MTSEALEMLWAVRLEGLRLTAAHAADFKECEQCRGVIPKTIGTCPWCHCYRFKEDAEKVLATLNEMAKNPYPVTVGVVPRLTEPGQTFAPMLGSNVIIGQPSPERPHERELGFFS